MKLFKILTLFKLNKRFVCNKPLLKTMKYLNVAEKNDAAKNIAAILSKGSSTRREGLSTYNKIYEFNCTVFGQSVRMVMTSVSGHLLTYEFTSNFRNWQSCNPVQLFDAPIVKTCPPDYQKIKKTLEREIRSCQGLIIWTDCDREGENIGYEIIKVCTDIIPNLRVYRAKFSEITQQSIQRAINNLQQPNQNISDAVDVRQELDLRTGAAFTRLQTLRLQKVFPQKLSDKLISYGSCQFPTLGFVVERYQIIEDFISEPFWRIKMNHTIKEITTEFAWQRDRLFDKNACEAILDICKENPTAVVTKIESKPKSKWRPLPLDTVEMEKTVSKKLKITAKETMKIAEKLYSQGYISYPRTETNIFPKELNLTNIVEQQINDHNWGEFAQRILNDNNGPQPRQGKKSDQAHPPIHPIKYTNQLNGNEQRVYEYIVRHFLACVQKDAKGYETIVNVIIANEHFYAKGLIVLEKNYLDVYIYEKWNTKEIYDYKENDRFEPTILELIESNTTPPKLLTESDLIALMDKHGIGTDATHAEHIDKIKSREYVGLHENIYFVPGTLGMGLVEGYNNIGLEVSLAKPILRAEFENDLKLICDGLKNPEIVRCEQIQKYRNVFEIVCNQIQQIDTCLGNRLNHQPEIILNENLINNTIINKTIFKCPKCNCDMIVKERQNGTGKFISCNGYPACKYAIWLPQNIENIDVLDEHCNQCGPDTRKVKIKFKQNIFPGEPNPNILCIGGCDRNVMDALDIRRPSTTNTSIIRNNSINNSRNDSFQNFQQTFINTTTPTTTTTNEIVCSCNIEAVQLTVRKDGPNKGRKFYKCRNNTCEFFLWEIENPTVDNTTTTTTTVQNRNQNNLKCNCGLPVVMKTVSKQGANTGRQFYCCSKPMGQSCNFFKWKDDNDGAGGSNGGGGGGDDNDDDNNSGGRRNYKTKKPKTNQRNQPYNNNNTKPKAKRKCGVCGQEGHTRVKCPNA